MRVRVRAAMTMPRYEAYRQRTSPILPCLPSLCAANSPAPHRPARGMGPSMPRSHGRPSSQTRSSPVLFQATRQISSPRSHTAETTRAIAAVPPPFCDLSLAATARCRLASSAPSAASSRSTATHPRCVTAGRRSAAWARTLAHLGLGTRETGRESVTPAFALSAQPKGETNEALA